MSSHKCYSFFCRFSKQAIIFIILFFSSCQPAQESKPSDKISPHEREWLTQFFSDIMLCQQGIYTLWGAHKPITIIPVENYSEEEMKAIYDSHMKKKTVKRF